MFNPLRKKALVLKCLQYKAFENTVEKGEIASNEGFLTIRKTYCHFPQICLQTLSVSKGLKFVVWERVKTKY